MLKNNQDYEDQQFKQLSAEKEQFKGLYFEDCHFIDCLFSEATFERCQFNECTFQNCDLSLTVWEGSSFQNGRFKHSKLIGVDWTRLTWSKYVKESPLRFEHCALDYGTFIGLSIQKQKMSSCSLKEVDFTEANLTGTVFDDCDLTGTQFRHTNCTKAQFQTAKNYLINPKINDLTNAQFALPEAVNLLHAMDIVISD
ncbi:MAG: pentapeptide repeat-containing protein [Chloroflexota bacterium]